jgi:hypothetical protein
MSNLRLLYRKGFSMYLWIIRLRFYLHFWSAKFLMSLRLLSTEMPLPRLEFYPGLHIQMLEAFRFYLFRAIF